ncbi:MAG: hypothetical protein MZU79_04235 [Anaerotruncus sp.]|nr:hypothetical protein [Anaerotruncus sp.]
MSQSPLPFEPAGGPRKRVGGRGANREEEAAAEPEAGNRPPSPPARPAGPDPAPARGRSREEIRRGIEPLDESEEAGPRPPFSFCRLLQVQGLRRPLRRHLLARRPVDWPRRRWA